MNKEISFADLSKNELQKYVEFATNRTSKNQQIMIIIILFISIYSFLLILHLVLSIYYFYIILDIILIVPIIGAIILFKFWQLIENSRENTLIKLMEYEKQNNVKLIPDNYRIQINIKNGSSPNLGREKYRFDIHWIGHHNENKTVSIQ